MDVDLTETQALLRRAVQKDREALEVLLGRFGERLRRMLRLRLDPRLRPRVDEDDVLQEVLLEASQRMDAYLKEPTMPFFVWLRFLGVQRVAALHRHHLGVQGRDVRREVRLDRSPLPGAQSTVMAARLAARLTSPSQGAARAELHLRLQRTLDGMDARDREILALRHFEQLTNAEAAHVLELEVSAASKRYSRALARLRMALDRAAQNGTAL
jgi:RNA polymerase sigma-70 factor (ECF subfamily)